MSVYSIVRDAILTQKIVKGTYHGHHREMCPHVIGHTEGREQALFYQFAGTSTTGLPPGGEWRCIVLAELTGVSVHAGTWHTGQRHTRPQTCVKEIDVEVAH